MDHAVDDRGLVVAHRDHEAPRRQLTIGQMEFAAGADRHRREPFCALLFKREALPTKIKSNFVSALHQLSNECRAKILQKDNISSRLIIGKASHIERFQEHAGKSSWDVIPHDA